MNLCFHMLPSFCCVPVEEESDWMACPPKLMISHCSKALYLFKIKLTQKLVAVVGKHSNKIWILSNSILIKHIDKVPKAVSDCFSEEGNAEQVLKGQSQLKHTWVRAQTGYEGLALPLSGKAVGEGVQLGCGCCLKALLNASTFISPFTLPPGQLCTF